MDLVGRFGPITPRFAPAVEPDETQRVDDANWVCWPRALTLIEATASRAVCLTRW
jgi:hypothetical protein